MADVTLYRLNLYDSLAILPIQVLAPGVKVLGVAPFGNSILSTLWVKTLDPGASVTVNWYDYCMDQESYPGARVNLGSHPSISVADKSSRLIVTQIHNKCFAEVIVTGGNAEAGIFVTSVSSFAMDAPFLDETVFNSVNDAGNANVLLDPTDGKFYIARGTGGAANVNIVGGAITEQPFDVKILSDQRQTTPNAEQTLLNINVPALKSWRLRNLKIISRCYGKFVLEADSVIIGEGVTSPAESNAKYEIFPYWPMDENLNVKVKFTQNFGPIMDVSAYLQLTEQDM